MTASEPSKELPTLKTPKALLHELLQINYSSARPEYVTEKVRFADDPSTRSFGLCANCMAIFRRRLEPSAILRCSAPL